MRGLPAALVLLFALVGAAQAQTAELIADAIVMVSRAIARPFRMVGRRAAPT